MKNLQKVDGIAITRLLDDIQFNSDTRGCYNRIAYRIENPAGLDHGSQVLANFSPDSEDLQIHKIQVFREGILTERTGEGDFNTIQRELNLETSLVLDGALTVVKVLHDVRVGDIIDFSFSRIQKRPRYPDDYSFLYWAQSDSSLGLSLFFHSNG